MRISVPLPGFDFTTRPPPRRSIRVRIERASPWRSPGTASGSNPTPRSRNEHTDLVRFDFREQIDVVHLRVLGSVDECFTRGAENGGDGFGRHVVVRRHVPDDDGHDRHPVLILDLARDRPQCFCEGSSRRLVPTEQPASQFAFLAAREPKNFLLIGSLLLDEGEGLQYGIVQV